MIDTGAGRCCGSWFCGVGATVRPNSLGWAPVPRVGRIG